MSELPRVDIRPSHSATILASGPIRGALRVGGWLEINTDRAATPRLRRVVGRHLLGSQDRYLRAPGINLKWIANDKRPGDWHIGGFKAGAEGAIVTGSVKGSPCHRYRWWWTRSASCPTNA